LAFSQTKKGKNTDATIPDLPNTAFLLLRHHLDDPSDGTVILLAKGSSLKASCWQKTKHFHGAEETTVPKLSFVSKPRERRGRWRLQRALLFA
jgi:hypothetical protein